MPAFIIFLPEFNGHKTLWKKKEQNPLISVIVVAGNQWTPKAMSDTADMYS